MLNLQVLQVSYQSVEKATPQAQNETSRSTTTCILFLFFLLVEDLQCSIKIVIFFLILHREVTTLRRFLDFQWSSTTENNRKQYKNTDWKCWRQCVSPRANYYHIFGGCSNQDPYWRDIHKTLITVFKTCTLRPCRDEERFKVLQALLAASKNCITRKQLNSALPTVKH